MMIHPEPAVPLSVRQLVEWLAGLDRQDGPVGIALFDHTGRVTIQAAHEVTVCHPPGADDQAEPPAVLIVAGRGQYPGSGAE